MLPRATHPVWRALLCALVLALLLPSAAAASPDAAQHGRHGLRLEVLSSDADQVSGGDALVRVRVPRWLALDRVRVERNGEDVTGALRADREAHALVGVVGGLRLGRNVLEASARVWWFRLRDRLRVTNFPITGPIFSGPQQRPFVCKTEQAGLGQPLVDNQDGIGIPVFRLDETGDKTGEIVGWSQDCGTERRVDYLYRSTSGEWKPLDLSAPRPGDVARTTTLEGRTVDYVVRRERGTINRFIYSLAVLAPFDTDPVDPHPLWNGRLIYSFQGGVGIGHEQGTPSTSASLYDNGLRLGYGIAYSTGTRTGVHYNLVLGGETALMVKERFVEAYGVPLYTVGVGGSGGGIQQYVYGQNHEGLIDAAIPQYSYPDMVTQTIHIGDCELLEYYMDVTDGDNPKWRDWRNRSWLIGLNDSATVRNPYTGQPGSDECVQSWRGLTPLALNPHFGSAGEGQELLPPEVVEAIEWTHWADLVNIYGRDRDGFARVAWGNEGVQYGLEALRAGHLTPAEFLDLNAKVGSWKPTRDMVQEGCPFVPPGCTDPARWDPWSHRNATTPGPDGIAPRRAPDLKAVRAAYRSGIVFRGDIDVPVIDWRHYLEAELDMHNSHQSFAARVRITQANGDHDNQVIWFTDARPNGPEFDQTPEALAVMDQWMANLRAHPERGVAGNKPPLAVDRCFDTQGNEIARGDHVWDGTLDDRPDGACTERFPVFGTSRTVAGGPIEGGIFACHRQPVDRAIRRGLYGDWDPSRAERARLRAIFPTGVCDYTKGDAGRPG